VGEGGGPHKAGPDPGAHSPDKKHYEAALQTTNFNLARKKESMQYYEAAKAISPRASPRTRTGSGRWRRTQEQAAQFKEGDARRAQVNELAAAMEKKQKEMNAKAYARTFFNNGDQYYRSYDFQTAVAQYDQGLKAMSQNGDTKDPDYAKYAKLREDAAGKDKHFKELYAYVAGLATTASPLDEATIKKGIASAEEGLKIRPRNGDMEIHWNRLKWKLGELQRANAKKEDDQRKCEAKWPRARRCTMRGNMRRRWRSSRRNVACAPGNAQREAYIRQLEETLRKQAAAKQACLAVRQQGDALVQQKRYADAIAKYRESLKCNPDAQLEAYIRQLEGEVKKQADAQANAARANQLRAEGTQLQNQKRYAEAIAKYRESLRYVPDKALEQHVAQIEAEVKKQNDQQALQARAKTLRDEGAVLQGQNRIREAIASTGRA
jgi:tetratricopeptide (TPR) repeat protein